MRAHPLPRVPRALLTLLSAALLVLGSWIGAQTARAQEDREAPRVDVLHVEGAITPVVASYLERSLTDAEDEGTALVVIRLDTPGGSVTVTDGVVKRMVSADIPVVVWVGPRGAMAASAGTFVTLAAHVAAMAPGTSIGAASPISGQGQEMSDTARSKIENTLVTQVRNLAARRGVQAQDWAEAAVREAVSAGPEEMLQLQVIDVIATDLDDLLEKLDGRAVTVKDEAVALRTLGAEVRQVEMDAFESVLHTLASPNVAYILMTLGMMGLVYEFANPGFGFGGVVGAICLLLGIYALGVLPANYAGVALILLAFGLFFADAKLGTGGLIALGGVVSMVVGGMILFDTPHFSVSPSILWTTALSCGAFFAFAASRVLAVNRTKATTGREGLVGARGRARGALAPEGIVLVWGENWRATAEGGDVAAGAAVEVTAVDGLRLHVRAAEEHEHEETP